MLRQDVLPELSKMKELLQVRSCGSHPGTVTVSLVRLQRKGQENVDEFMPDPSAGVYLQPIGALHAVGKCRLLGLIWSVTYKVEKEGIPVTAVVRAFNLLA